MVRQGLMCCMFAFVIWILSKDNDVRMQMCCKDFMWALPPVHRGLYGTLEKVQRLAAAVSASCWRAFEGSWRIYQTGFDALLERPVLWYLPLNKSNWHLILAQLEWHIKKQDTKQTNWLKSKYSGVEESSCKVGRGKWIGNKSVLESKE